MLYKFTQYEELSACTRFLLELNKIVAYSSTLRKLQIRASDMNYGMILKK